MRAAIYARVSTMDQNCDMQLAELREHIRRRGWSPAGEYVDTGWSGAKASRPELDRLMAHARARKFDAVLCWKLDRFGRSLLNCLSAIQELRASGVRFICASQNIDTDESNPASRFLLHILMAAAEFERELIRERALAGLKRYRQDYDAGRVGKERRSRSGKNQPIGRPRRVYDRQRAAELRAQGLSYRQIAARLSVGEATVRRSLQTARNATDARQNPAARIL
jgi:putative DNA-invertase from lambdoid prophage Rac